MTHEEPASATVYTAPATPPQTDGGFTLSLNRLRIISALVLGVGLVAFALLRVLIPHVHDGGTAGYVADEFVVGLPIVGAVLAAWWLMLRVLDRRNRQLTKLGEAAVAIGAEISAERAASHVPALARVVVDVPYAALVVHGERPHTESSGTPPRGRRTLNIPLVAGEELLAELEVGLKPGQRLSESDRAALDALAALVAATLERARLHGQIGVLAAARERDRIKRDLHDGLTQRLYALGLQVEQAELLAAEDGSRAGGPLGQIRLAVRAALKDTRRYVHGLEGGDVSVSLGSALNRLAAEFPRSVELDIVDDVKLSASAAADVLHVVREATANALRHTTSTRVVVRVVAKPSQSVVSVGDNGEGFDTTVPSLGLGIHNMRDRAQSLGGSVEVRSAPGRGTIVRLSVPRPDGPELRE